MTCTSIRKKSDKGDIAQLTQPLGYIYVSNSNINTVYKSN